MTITPTERDLQGTWAKLRRRKVVQWGVAYVAASWALLQGIDFLAEAFNWPNESRQVATLCLLIGLPIALVIAWYHGDRGEQHVGRAELAVLTGLFMLAGGVLWWYGSGLSERRSVDSDAPAGPDIALADLPSIAVLPFVNLSPGDPQEYLADAIPGEILQTLARTPGLYVPARGSSFLLKGRTQDPRVAATQLNVAHLLTGTIRRSGSEMRVMTQLVRAADGAVLWSGMFDGSVEEIDRMQHAIAEQVIASLKVPRAAAAESSQPVARIESASAYEMYLEGRYLLDTRKVENVHRAIDLLREASSRDPTFAEAQSAFAVAVLISRDYPSDSSAGNVPITQAEQAARRALELDPSLGEPYAVLGMIAASRRDWPEAEARFKQGISAARQNAMVNMWYGNFLRAVGRVGDATRYFQLAWQLDPLSPVSLGNLAVSYVSIGDKAAGKELLQIAEARGMRHPAISVAWIGVATDEKDQALTESALREWFAFFPGWIPVGAEPVLARAVFDQASRPAAWELLADLIWDERQLEGWGTLLIAALIGDFDTAFASADHSSPQGGISWGMAYWHPSVSEWRSDARFKRVVQRLQLPQYWQHAGWPDACRPTGDADFKCTG